MVKITDDSDFTGVGVYPVLIDGGKFVALAFTEDAINGDFVSFRIRSDVAQKLSNELALIFGGNREYSPDEALSALILEDFPAPAQPADLSPANKDGSSDEVRRL